MRRQNLGEFAIKILKEHFSSVGLHKHSQVIIYLHNYIYVYHARLFR